MTTSGAGNKQPATAPTKPGAAPGSSAHGGRPASAPPTLYSGGDNCPPARYGPQYSAPLAKGGGKTVALTFDDGPGPSTPAILSILLRYKVRATFFDIGDHEAKLPALVKEQVRDGFLVGSHTWSHPRMTSLSPTSQAAQLDATASEQRTLTGTSPCVFRPPFGSYDSTTLALARQRHMSVWMWSVDTQDWKADGSGSPYWVARIIHLAESEGISQQHPIVIMHNESLAVPALVAALPVIIKFFKAHGYRFVDLLGRTGPPEAG